MDRNLKLNRIHFEKNEGLYVLYLHILTCNFNFFGQFDGMLVLQHMFLQPVRRLSIWSGHFIGWIVFVTPFESFIWTI